MVPTGNVLSVIENPNINFDKYLKRVVCGECAKVFSRATGATLVKRNEDRKIIILVSGQPACVAPVVRVGALVHLRACDVLENVCTIQLFRVFRRRSASR